jgi:hypothetical protein
MVETLTITLLGLGALWVALLAAGGPLLVRPVRTCPACFEPTAPVLVRWLERLTRLEWRWCTYCGWSGLGRRGIGRDGP